MLFSFLLDGYKSSCWLFLSWRLMWELQILTPNWLVHYTRCKPVPPVLGNSKSRILWQMSICQPVFQGFSMDFVYNLLWIVCTLAFLYRHQNKNCCVPVLCGPKISFLQHLSIHDPFIAWISCRLCGKNCTEN